MQIIVSSIILRITLQQVLAPSQTKVYSICETSFVYDDGAFDST